MDMSFVGPSDLEGMDLRYLSLIRVSPKIRTLLVDMDGIVLRRLLLVRPDLGRTVSTLVVSTSTVEQNIFRSVAVYTKLASPPMIAFSQRTGQDGFIPICLE
jgi:hypothetical protein